MLVSDQCAHALKTVNVHVESARADVVAARQGDVDLSAASEQGAEYADGGSHPADKVIVSAVLEGVGYGDLDSGRRLVVSDLAPQPAQQFAHDLHVEDVGHFGEGGGTTSEQGCRHELEDRILRPGHSYLANQARATSHGQGLHISILRT